jgi:aryl-alcohol dehydrogenase-like predicted oxidoreductase
LRDLFEMVRDEDSAAEGCRVALGAAQFGQRYGIANRVGTVTVDEVGRILRRARDSGIDTIDTAIAYGDSESCLGEQGVAEWNVVTKLPPLPPSARNVGEWALDQVSQSLARLRLTKLHALLLHRPSDLRGSAGEDYRRALSELKNRGLVEAVGISIYAPEELETLLPLWRPDLIQVPCSVIDRRVIQSRWLERLRSEGIRVHARSVFMQGLLLMRKADRPAWFAPWTDVLDEWLSWCGSEAISPLHAALGFTLKQGFERVVVGVDSDAHLREVVDAARTSAPLPPNSLFSTDPLLVEPSRWRLK